MLPFLSGTSPNQNFVKNPDVQDMGLSSVDLDHDRSPAAAAASDAARLGSRADLAGLLLVVLAILNTN